MTTQNGIGASVLRATVGTAVVVRWNPELSVTIDGEPVVGVDSVEVSPGYGTIPDIITFNFRGKPAQRATVIGRSASAFAATPDNDGFTATLAAL